VYVKSRKATLGSSEVSTMIFMRDYETRLDFLEIGMRKPRVLQGYPDTNYVGDLDQ